MKTIIVAIILLASALMMAFGATLKPNEQGFILTPSPDQTVSHYAIYIGTNSGSYQVRITFTNQLTLWIAKTNFAPGITNFYTATAVDTNGIESVPCPERSFVPPPPPADIKLSTTILESESADGPWIELTNLPPVVLASTAPRKFYRSKVEITP